MSWCPVGYKDGLITSHDRLPWKKLSRTPDTFSSQILHHYCSQDGLFSKYRTDWKIKWMGQSGWAAGSVFPTATMTPISGAKLHSPTTGVGDPLKGGHLWATLQTEIEGRGHWVAKAMHQLLGNLEACLCFPGKEHGLAWSELGSQDGGCWWNKNCKYLLGLYNLPPLPAP